MFMKRKYSEIVEEEEEKEKEPAAKRRKIDDDKEENASNMANEDENIAEDIAEKNFAEEGSLPINPIFDVVNSSSIEDIKDFITAEKKKDGFDISAVDQDGLTPLHYAIERGDSDIVALLCEEGAGVDVDVELEGGVSDKNELTTPLHYAIYLKNADVAKVLVTAGANTNIKDKNGDTPLHLAVISNNTEIVQFLSKSPEILNQRNKAGQDPLDAAIYNKKTEVAKVLIEVYNEISLPLPINCLHNAATYGLPKIVELLIEKGIKVDSLIQDNYIYVTPLFFATNNGHIDVVNILIQNGANVHLKCRGESLLYYAVNTRNPGMVETLVKAGIDINTTTTAGLTLLHEAIRELESFLPTPIGLFLPTPKPIGLLETIEKLVELGANIEEITSSNSELSKILEVAKSADKAADSRYNSITEEIKLLLMEDNMQQLFLKRFETYLMKYGSVCSFDDYRTYLSEAFPNKLTNSEKTGLLDKLEEDSISKLEVAEGSMLHITKGFSSDSYSVLLRNRSLQDDETTTNTLEFYEKNPKYKIPGAFLASILEDEHQLLNEMFYNINFARAIENILNICINQSMKIKLTSIWTQYEEEVVVKNPLAQVVQSQGAEIEWLKEEITQDKKAHKQEMIETHNAHSKELKQVKEELESKLAKVIEFMQQIEVEVLRHSTHQGDHSHASITHGEASLSGEIMSHQSDGIS